ncbi:MAG TPA: peptide chain release factor N(5)-glutamine methyltransferase [Verrucomicrobiae bacterium]|nr:peptide chain release factor N(5)-glutamine methyltransferase [Verrucomicrobiae bacterium]
MTVLESIQKSTEFLQKKGIDSPRLHAELLLAHVLRLPRMKLYLAFERVLTAPETDALRESVRRRALREPLQHIVGTTSFCGFEISVNRHTLVPRPETELLAEAGWTFLAQTSSPSALDFGTGTGCIAIALASKCPAARVAALDVSPDALLVAQANAERHCVADRIQFVPGSGLEALPPDVGPFDLIISNPPYIPSSEIETLEPEVRDFDPRLALDGGTDGLDFYRRLANEAGALLKPQGKLMVEFGDGQCDAIHNICSAQKWIVDEIREDYTRRQRILIARRE